LYHRIGGQQAVSQHQGRHVLHNTSEGKQKYSGRAPKIKIVLAIPANNGKVLKHLDFKPSKASNCRNAGIVFDRAHKVR
jgi:hypothetical protein